MDPNAIQALIDSALSPLSEKMASQEARISSLEEEMDAAFGRVKKLEKKIQELTPPDAELVFNWARRWRMLMPLAGLVGPGLGLGSDPY